MKNLKKIMFIIFILVLCFLTACAPKLTEEEKAVAGTYELIYATINDNYLPEEYYPGNYLELGKNKEFKYVLTTGWSHGTWSIDEDNIITLRSPNGTENTYLVENNSIVMYFENAGLMQVFTKK